MLAILLSTLAPCLPLTQEPDWLDHFLSGSRELERGNLDEAKTALEAAYELFPEHAAIAWQLAGVHARQGNSEAALERLEWATSNGGGEAGLLKWDPDLVTLHETPRFESILAKLEERDSSKNTQTFEAEIAWGVEASAATAPSLPINRIVTDIGGHSALFDLRAQETIEVFERTGQPHTTSMLSPDERWVITSGFNLPSILIHDAITGELVSELEQIGQQTAVQFSSDGKRMLTHRFGMHAGDLEVWETDSWNRIATMPHGSAANVHFSPDGSRVLTFERGGTFTFWNVDDSSVLRKHGDLPSIPNTEMGFSVDGTLAFLLENQGPALHIYDSRNGDELSVIVPAKDRFRFRQACFLGASGNIAVKGEGQRLAIFHAREGELLREFEIETDNWVQLDATHDGKLLLVADFRAPLRAYDTLSGELVWETDSADYGGASLSADGEFVLIGKYRVPDSIRDVRTGQLLVALTSKSQPSSVCTHPVRQELWVGVSDGSLRRVDVETGRHKTIRQDSKVGFRSLAFDEEGRWLSAIDESGSLFVIDTKLSELKLRVPSAQPSKVHWRFKPSKFAANGTLLIIPESANTLAIYTTEDGSRVRIDTVKRYSSWDATGDGETVAAVCGNQLYFFNGATGDRTHQVAIADGISSVAFEPDNDVLWVGTNDSTVVAVQVATGEILRSVRFRAHDEHGDGVHFANMTFSSTGELGLAVSKHGAFVAAWTPESGERLWDYDQSSGNPTPLYCAVGRSNDRGYVWGQGPWAPRIVDAKSGATLLNLADRAIERIHALADESAVAVTASRGLEVLEVASDSSRWSRFDLPSDGWLLSTTSNHFDGTRHAIDSAHILLEDHSYPLESLASALIDPKRVRAAADGIELFPARLFEIPKLAWSAEPTRERQLRPDEGTFVIALDASCEDGISKLEVMRDGLRSFISGEQFSNLELAAPPPGESTQYRFRAVSRRGVLTRPLHLTVARSQ